MPDHWWCPSMKFALPVGNYAQECAEAERCVEWASISIRFKNNADCC